MTLIQLFDEKKCIEVRCDKLSIVNNNVVTCYGIPESCEVNNKNGYPKEIKD